MDPTARRETWEIIKEAKKEKIIILTTHYMDEAEMLADRVAIISRGSLKVCGTTFFLKQKYGMGYFFEFDELAKDSEIPNKELNDLISYYANLPVSRDSLPASQNHLATSQTSYDQDKFQILQNEQGRTVYKVPYSISQNFKPLFEELDGKKQKYEISDYSIRCSTLEEVFIKIGEEEAKAEDEEFHASFDVN